MPFITKTMLLDNSLSDMYDAIKADNKNDNPVETKPAPFQVTNPFNNNAPLPMNHPMVIKWKNHAGHECEKLKNKCAKHIILDIYCKILPLDDDFKCGHMGMMKHDVDCMLKKKDMSPTQYLTSAYESTHAPLLEFINRSINLIGESFMEEAEEELKQAQQDGVDVPPPEAPEEVETDDNINSQLVEIKDDMEYDSFVEILKKQTIDKIVNDVSAIINQEKEENDMVFDPKPDASKEVKEPVAESAVAIGIDYLQTKLLKENVQIDEHIEEEIIGMAIRESVLNEMDKVFNMPNSDMKNFINDIRFNKGTIINESAVKSYTNK